MAEEPPLLFILISRIDLLGFSVVRAEKKNETENLKMKFEQIPSWAAYRMVGMLCTKIFSDEVSIADPYIDGKLI